MRFAAVLCLALAACQQAPVAPLPPLNFAGQPPLVLNVSRIDIAEDNPAPSDKTAPERQATQPPAAAVRQWANARLRAEPDAAGQNKSLQVAIQDASIRRTALPVKAGASGWFTDEQSQQLAGHLQIELRVYGPESALSEASVRAEASRSATVRENASAAERRKILDGLIQGMVQDADAQLERNARAYFGAYLK